MHRLEALELIGRIGIDASLNDLHIFKERMQFSAKQGESNEACTGYGSGQLAKEAGESEQGKENGKAALEPLSGTQRAPGQQPSPVAY